MLRTFVPAIALLVCLPLSAFAHKVWLLPSQTVLSGAEPLVTVDAAVSNDLFYFNHFPLRLDNLVITAPDGSTVVGENQATLRYRSVFDVPLKQEGTYRIAINNHGLFGSWEENGERRRWRGTPETFAKEVPANAKNLQVSESIGRVETFVTNGAPTEKVFETTGKGIELVPVTHPNDLYVGEKGTFRFLVDGKPVAGMKIEIIQGGTRYRDTQNEVHLTTDERGEFTVEWKEPGMYWLETSSQDSNTQIKQAQNRRLSYAATFEVLPQ